jgi:arylsulfatase
LPKDRPRRSYAAGKFFSTDAITDYAIDFLAGTRKAKESQPWFLYAAYNAPHFPLQAPREDVERYAKLYEQGWDKIREQRLEGLKELRLVPEGCVLPARELVPPNPIADKHGWTDKANPAWESLPADRRADLARRMAIYAAMVDRLDQNIGRLIADLRQHKDLDNTLIFFLSDNGACAEWDPFGFDGDSGPKNILHTGADLAKLGGPDSYISYGSGWANACNTPFRWYKHYGHEGGISTPLIVHWPAGIAARGEIRTQPGHLVDLMATCVEVAGGKYPGERNGHKVLPMESCNLTPAFANRPIARDSLAWEHEGNRALRAGDWKIVALKGQAWELYDLANDRVERNNLAAQEPERVKELAARWNAWARRTQVYPSPVLGKEP